MHKPAHLLILLLFLLIYIIACVFFIRYTGHWIQHHPRCRHIYITLLSLWAILPFISFPISFKQASLQAAWLNICYTWLPVLLYGILLVLLYHITMRMCQYWGHTPSPLWSHTCLPLCALALILTTLLCVGHYKFSHIRSTHVHIPLSEQYPNMQPFTMVAFSDLHLGAQIGIRQTQACVQAVNNARPQVVVIGGDLVERGFDRYLKPQVIEELKKIQAPWGVWAVSGNHEHYAGYEKAQALLKECGFHMLEDSSVLLPSQALLIGRKDKTDADRLPVSRLLEHADTTLPTLMIDHQPNSYREVCRQHISFQFSGHTHAGQFWPLSYIINAANNMGYGCKLIQGTWMCVSSGVGIWGPLYRIGVPSSEIMVIHFE